MDQVSRCSHQTNRDEEIPGINITINATESCMDITDSMTAEEISSANTDDEHQSMLSEHVCMAGQAIKES